MYFTSEFVDGGGLMSYAPSFTEQFRRAADLRGQDPKGGQARRLTGGAADEVRIHHQSEGRETDRSDDSAVNVLARADKVIK